MIKIRIGILMLLTGMFIFSSCNNNRTYADMKKDQDRAINQLISENNFEILNRYPADSVFKDNQFVLLDNGVYLNVVDSGNGNRAEAYRTQILMRCSGRHIYKSDTSSFDLFLNEYSPIEFMYGYASQVANEYYSSYGFYSPASVYLSAGLESALQYVGENAIVKLIIPFEVGSPYQSTPASTWYGAPIYYDRVRFQFY